MRRAEVHTNPAPLALDRIDGESGRFRPDSVVSTGLLANTAAVTAVGVDTGLMPGMEFVDLHQIRFQQQVQVGCIHVQIADDGIIRQMGKCCRERGLAGAPLAADYKDFMHAAPPDRWNGGA